MSDPDWRLTGQHQYLSGVTLVRHQWRESRPGWDHDHCEFCLAKFGDERLPDVLREGWTTPDEYRWICDTCFSDFRVHSSGMSRRHRADWRERARRPCRCEGRSGRGRSMDPQDTAGASVKMSFCERST